MTQEQFNKLKRGDIVQNKQSCNSYIISQQIDTPDKVAFIGVDTIYITNPNEWELYDNSSDEVKKLQNEIRILKTRLEHIHNSSQP
jgi:hypothetical protein